MRIIRVLAITFSGTLAGCTTIGPQSIVSTRNNYNEAIHSTSAEQLLLNVVRVKQSEFPTFADVLETDSTNAATLGLAGGSSNIGVMPAIGALTGTASYGDSELVRLAPVQGFALIQQISTPMPPSTIVNLTNSDFNLNPVLEFAVDRLTPGYKDFYRAEDIITILNEYGALTLGSGTMEAAKNAKPNQKSNDKSVSRDTSKSGAVSSDKAPNKQSDSSKEPETLVLHFIPKDTLTSDHTRPLERGLLQCLNDSQNRSAATLWQNLLNVYGVKNAGEVDVVLSSYTGNGKVSFFATRSAMGTLKLGENNGSDFAYVSRDEEKAILEYNTHAPCRIGYFHMRPLVLDQYNVDAAWRGYVNDAFDRSEGSNSRERERDQNRSYILIVKSSSAPDTADAYVSVYRKGYWYWIDDNDSVSKLNFALLNQFMTIQAIPSQSQPLTPALTIH